MERSRTPEEAMELIEYLVSKGKRPKSFENTFPRIHHFKGGSGSLKAHLDYIGDPDAVKTYSRKSNQNIVRRLELIRLYTDEFLADNPGWDAINEYKYQIFAAQAIEKIPI